MDLAFDSNGATWPGRRETENNDILIGNSDLYGGEGDDWLFARNHNMILFLFGENGNDHLYGNVGDDRLFGD